MLAVWKRTSPRRNSRYPLMSQRPPVGHLIVCSTNDELMLEREAK